MWFNMVYVCQADAEKCIFVWTILSQTPRRTPQVTSDAGRISARIFLLFPKERRMLRKRDYQGRLSFHFFDRWMTDLATHRQKKVEAMSWKNLQMLEFCLFTWSWMGPINCAPNPHNNNGRNLVFHSRRPEKSYFNIEIINLLVNSKLGQ